MAQSDVRTFPAGDSVSAAVVDAVAEREGVDPVDLKTPLYDSIDPDALDAIFRTERVSDRPARYRVEFTYHGYDVVITGDGQIDLAPVPDSIR